MLWCGGEEGYFTLEANFLLLQVLFKYQEESIVRSYNEMFIPVEFLPSLNCAHMCKYSPEEICQAETQNLLLRSGIA